MIHAERVNDLVLLRSEWYQKDDIASIPGSSWRSADKMWSLPLSWASCMTLRGVFGSQLSIGPALNAWAHSEVTNRIKPVTALRELLSDDSVVYREFAPDTTNDHDDRLYPFQKVGRAFLVKAGDALLADEMGTGKSVQVMAALHTLDDALPALIVCPNTLKQHWVRHANEWLPEANTYLVAGTANQRRKILVEAKKDPKALVVINIEAIRGFSRLAPYGSMYLKRCTECDPKTGDESLKPAKCDKHPKELNAFGFKTVVIDEAHRVKSPTALQTRALWSIAHDSSVIRRWALTGTPIANHPGELWPIMHAVSPKEYPNRSKFIDRFAQQELDGWGSVRVTGLKSETKEELFRILDPRFRRMPKALVLADLPDKVRVTHMVDMDPKQAKAYKELSKNLMTELDDGTFLVAASNLAAQTRLLQLSSSFCEIDKGDTPEDPASWVVNMVSPSPKVKAMMEILEDLDIHNHNGTGTSVVIAAEHRKLLELAEERLNKEGIPYVVVSGAVPEAIRAMNVEEFQQGKVPVLLMTYKAGGVGLTMTRANVMICLQRSWSLVDNMQGRDRIHRIGSEVHDSVTIIDVVADNTIEVVQQRRLAEKLERLEEIVRDRAALTHAGVSTASLDTEETALMGTYLGQG